MTRRGGGAGTKWLRGALIGFFEEVGDGVLVACLAEETHKFLILEVAGDGLESPEVIARLEGGRDEEEEDVDGFAIEGGEIDAALGDRDGADEAIGLGVAGVGDGDALADTGGPEFLAIHDGAGDGFGIGGEEEPRGEEGVDNFSDGVFLGGGLEVRDDGLGDHEIEQFHSLLRRQHEVGSNDGRGANGRDRTVATCSRAERRRSAGRGVRGAGVGGWFTQGIPDGGEAAMGHASLAVLDFVLVFAELVFDFVDAEVHGGFGGGGLLASDEIVFVLSGDEEIDLPVVFAVFGFDLDGHKATKVLEELFRFILEVSLFRRLKCPVARRDLNLHPKTPDRKSATAIRTESARSNKGTAENGVWSRGNAALAVRRAFVRKPVRILGMRFAFEARGGGNRESTRPGSAGDGAVGDEITGVNHLLERLGGSRGDGEEPTVAQEGITQIIHEDMTGGVRAVAGKLDESDPDEVLSGGKIPGQIEPIGAEFALGEPVDGPFASLDDRRVGPIGHRDDGRDPEHAGIEIDLVDPTQGEHASRGGGRGELHEHLAEGGLGPDSLISLLVGELGLGRRLVRLTRMQHASPQGNAERHPPR